MMKSILKSTLFLFLVLFLACDKQNSVEKTQLQGPVFGTTYSIIYLNNSNNYKAEIINLFNDINASLSTYIPTSDISKINKGDTTIIVDNYFAEVFKKSKRIHKETNGFFDPTVGVLVNAWGFGPEKEIDNLTKNQVYSLMQFVGLDKVKLIDGKIKKANSEIFLDFNSIAKGYAVDVVARFLNDKNIDNYLIEIGGEIRAKGKNNQQKQWKIGIDDPNEDNTRTVSKLINLSNQSMASSGNYRKFRMDENGNKYVHTINPKTGFAQESNLLAATVIGEIDCAEADAYATAFMAMGLEKTKAFINSKKSLKVILYYLNEEGNFEEYTNYTYN